MGGTGGSKRVYNVRGDESKTKCQKSPGWTKNRGIKGPMGRRGKGEQGGKTQMIGKKDVWELQEKRMSLQPRRSNGRWAQPKNIENISNEQKKKNRKV